MKQHKRKLIENFKAVLERIIKPFEDDEDYETCIKIKSIIKKL